MKPTPNQLKLIDFFVEKLQDLKTMDVSTFQGEPSKLVKRINDKLQEAGAYDKNYAADAMGDVIITIINNP